MEGVEVSDFVDGEVVYQTIKLLDFETPSNNDWLVVNQLEVTEDAYNQLMNYKEVYIPSLFYYNAFLVISDGVSTKAGTITASYDRFMSWKKINAEDEVSNVDTMNLDTLMYDMFDKKRFLSIIKNFILFTNKTKIMAQYHQYYGMTKAIASCIKAVENDGRVGVVCHTQGSGKSVSMTFLVGNLVKSKALNNPTILVITDRNDLDGQLFATFCSAQDFLRQEQVHMESRSAVKEFLGGRKTGGVVFSTIQKFVEETGFLSDRENIIPDLFVPIEEKKTFNYYKEQTIKGYVHTFGWELITSANIVDKFMAFIEKDGYVLFL